MTDEMGDADPQDSGSWVFLTDPAWEDNGEPPPPEAVVGGWPVDPEGNTGLFRASPGYVPSAPGWPTDPVDVCLKQLSQGEADGEQLLKAVCETELAIAVDEEQTALIVPAPDGEPSVMVVTAPAHCERVRDVSWRPVTPRELAEALPDEGVDVLLNPGAPDSARLLGGALKEAMLDDGAGLPSQDMSEAVTLDKDTLAVKLAAHDAAPQAVDIVVTSAQDAVADTLTMDGEQAARQLSAVLPQALDALESNGVVATYLREAEDDATAGLSLFHALEAVARTWVDKGDSAGAALAREFLPPSGLDAGRPPVTESATPDSPTGPGQGELPGQMSLASDSDA